MTGYLGSAVHFHESSANTHQGPERLQASAVTAHGEAAVELTVAGRGGGLRGALSP